MKYNRRIRIRVFTVARKGSFSSFRAFVWSLISLVFEAHFKWKQSFIECEVCWFADLWITQAVYCGFWLKKIEPKKKHQTTESEELEKVWKENSKNKPEKTNCERHKTKIQWNSRILITNFIAKRITKFTSKLCAHFHPKKWLLKLIFLSPPFHIMCSRSVLLKTTHNEKRLQPPKNKVARNRMYERRD
jgi:hypothetical protein